VYDRAIAYTGPDPSLPPAKQEATRRKQQHIFEQELFVFVAVPGVPAENNLAERSVRPFVIARKISGGTRSPQGSDTRTGLFSLFGTWSPQGLNPFLQCLAVLSQNQSLPQM
jgi:hypothetical protein